jgi:hypothetical protein
MINMGWKYQVSCMDNRDYIEDWQNFDNVKYMIKYIDSMRLNEKVHVIKIRINRENEK